LEGSGQLAEINTSGIKEVDSIRLEQVALLVLRCYIQ
jgi:hypothetical protein